MTHVPFSRDLPCGLERVGETVSCRRAIEGRCPLDATSITTTTENDAMSLCEERKRACRRFGGPQPSGWDRALKDLASGF